MNNQIIGLGSGGGLPIGIIMQDDFTGTVIDTTKWNVTDIGDRITQNDQIVISLTYPYVLFDVKLQSIVSIPSGVAIAQAKIWTHSGFNAFSNQSGIILYVDNDNYALMHCTEYNWPTNGYAYIKIVKDGVEEYSLIETAVTGLKDFKVWTDGIDIKFFFWNGSAWAQIGITKSVSLGYPLYSVISKPSNNFNLATYIDDFYMSNLDYTTQYPV